MIKNGYVELIRSAFADFRRSKIRTLLTSLGIMIGVMSVVLLIALGLGLKNYITQQFESLGANLLFVRPGPSVSDSGGIQGSFSGAIGGIKFDEKDVATLKRIGKIDYVVPVYFKGSSITFEGKKKFGYLIGTNEDVFKILNLKVLKGVLFTKADAQAGIKSVVLGRKIAEDLFSQAEIAIGKTIRAENQRFKVIGVVENKGDPQMDSGVFMPYKVTFESMNPDKTFFTIYLGVHSKEDLEAVKIAAKNALLKRYNKDDFSIVESSEILSTINTIFGVINSVLVAIGSISLLVGGIGIMNIMYATVTERTKEVGIRRAIGATESDVLRQFLAESVLLSLIGGLLGLLLSSLIVLGVRIFFPASINLFSVVITLVISSAIGIFFGVFPARRAAKLPPIEAIRYE